MHAVEVAARLIPEANATVVHVWCPPFASAELRQRLVSQALTLDERLALIQQEGLAKAQRIAGHGVALAGAAGWNAQPLVERCDGGEGYGLARLAERGGADLLVLGSRGLSGLQAVLGSTSDLVGHVSAVPVLVVPFPLTTSEWDAVGTGPVLVASDGSPGTEAHDTLRIPLRRRPGSARAIAATLSECVTARPSSKPGGLCSFLCRCHRPHRAGGPPAADPGDDTAR